MTQFSATLSMPFIQPAQAQKHVTHNEAIQILDAVVQLVVQGTDQTTPPVNAANGACYLIPIGGQGDWAGHDTEVAYFNGTGWVFLAPRPGWAAYSLNENTTFRFDGTEWVAQDLNNISMIGVNSAADSVNRLSVSSEAVLLNHAGAGHQLKLNKAAMNDTASLVFQTGFSGRAEMGTAGNDDFSIKVTADGSNWNEALRIDSASGEVTLKQVGSREVLTGPRTYYVDPTLGSDANDGLNAAGGAFENLSTALVAAQNIDGGGHEVTIQLADGTYSITSPIVIETALVGVPSLNITGNTSSPMSVVLSALTEVFDIRAGDVVLTGVTVENADTNAAALDVSQNGTLVLSGVDFGTAGTHICLRQNAILTVDGDYSISGSAQHHVKATQGASTEFSSANIDLIGVPNFSSSFVTCDTNSAVQFSEVNFVGSASGRKFSTSYNGVIATFGQGLDFLPGDIDGIEFGGGVYF